MNWRDLPQHPRRARRRIRWTITRFVAFVDGLRQWTGDRRELKAPARVEVKQEWCR